MQRRRFTRGLLSAVRLTMVYVCQRAGVCSQGCVWCQSELAGQRSARST